jgi:hypothetical protein
MAKKISAGTRQELVVAIGARYRAAGRADKLRILDEFVAVTGVPPQARHSDAQQRRRATQAKASSLACL